jgi:uncharacterized membrane protein YkoI
MQALRSIAIGSLALLAGSAVALLERDTTVANAEPSASPATTVRISEDHPGLLARARVHPDSAVSILRRAGATGDVVEAEIEEEHGRLVYCFDVELPDGGVEEVTIDAMTGAVVGREREDADDEEDPDEDGRA